MSWNFGMMGLGNTLDASMRNSMDLATAINNYQVARQQDPYRQKEWYAQHHANTLKHEGDIIGRMDDNMEAWRMFNTKANQQVSPFDPTQAITAIQTHQAQQQAVGDNVLQQVLNTQPYINSAGVPNMNVALTNPLNKLNAEQIGKMYLQNLLNGSSYSSAMSNLGGY